VENSLLKLKRRDLKVYSLKKYVLSAVVDNCKTLFTQLRVVIKLNHHMTCMLPVVCFLDGGGSSR